jgi:predicted nuclease with TOPRIM domain
MRRGERRYRRPAMADEPDNLTLLLLRRIDTNVAEMRDDIQDLKIRMTHVEEGLAGVNRRLDRLDVRVDRLERRLELADKPL